MKLWNEVLAEEQENECQWFWLSFVGDEFLGGCFVLAPGPITAIKRAHDLGINPGGQVLGTSVKAPPLELQNRLLTKADLDAHGGWL